MTNGSTRIREVAALLLVAIVAASCGSDTAASSGTPETRGEADAPATADAVTEAPDPVTLTWSMHAPEAVPEGDMVNGWMDAVENCTDGQVSFERHWNGTLVSAPEILAAIRDGRVDVGLVPTSFSADALPLWEIVTIPFLGTDPIAAMQTLQDLYESNDIFRSEFANNDVHILAFLPTNSSSALTLKPINSLDDLKGLKLRTIGYTAKALEGVGTESVMIDGAEIYESLQRGVVEGLGAVPFNLLPAYGFHEVAPHITDLGMGYYADSAIGMKLSVWDELPDSAKSCMTDAANELITSTAAPITAKADEKACAELRGTGLQMNALDESAVEAWREQVEAGLISDFVSETASKGNYEPAEVERFVDAYRELNARYSQDSTYQNPVRACMSQN